MKDITNHVIEYIVDLKQKVGMSRAELSEITQIPLQTLNRILNQTTGAPSFDNIYKIVKALGGSLDVMTGLRSADNEPVSNVHSVKQAYDEAKAHLNNILEVKNRSIDYLKNQLKSERIQKYSCFGIILAMILMMIIMFIWVRWTTVS